MMKDIGMKIWFFLWMSFWLMVMSISVFYLSDQYLRADVFPTYTRAWQILARDRWQRSAWS
jgi:hypothetical protein